MSVLFQCPSCSRNLTYHSGDETFQTCRDCGGKIIVPSTAIHENAARKAQPSRYTLEKQRDYRLAEIQSELNAGRKVTAVKLFRDTFSADLATAKRAVEMLEQGQRIPGEALANIAPEAPIEQRVHGTAPVQPGGTVSSAPIVFWLILSVGIILAVLFLFNN